MKYNTVHGKLKCYNTINIADVNAYNRQAMASIISWILRSCWDAKYTLCQKTGCMSIPCSPSSDVPGNFHPNMQLSSVKLQQGGQCQCPLDLHQFHTISFCVQAAVVRSLGRHLCSRLSGSIRQLLRRARLLVWDGVAGRTLQVQETVHLRPALVFPTRPADLQLSSHLPRGAALLLYY